MLAESCFVTTYSTLTRTPSMLASMFSGLFTIEQEEDGSYFIDRDPTYFGQIINYLRDASINIKGLGMLEKEALLREAKYYQIDGLVRQLRTDRKKSQQASKLELSQEKEYKLIHVDEKRIKHVFKDMTMSEGYDFESWIEGSRGEGGAGRTYHLLFSKKLSRGELMLLDRLQNSQM